jgi:hypothetical protein
VPASDSDFDPQNTWNQPLSSTLACQQKKGLTESANPFSFLEPAMGIEPATY